MPRSSPRLVKTSTGQGASRRVTSAANRKTKTWAGEIRTARTAFFVAGIFLASSRPTRSGHLLLSVNAPISSSRNALSRPLIL